jgi:hypothetical protein
MAVIDYPCAVYVLSRDSIPLIALSMSVFSPATSVDTLITSSPTHVSRLAKLWFSAFTRLVAASWLSVRPYI